MQQNTCVFGGQYDANSKVRRRRAQIREVLCGTRLEGGRRMNHVVIGQ